MLSIPPIGEVIQVDGHAYRLLPVADIDQPVLDGLDRLWARIRAEHPAVPSVVIDIGPGRSSSCTSPGWSEVPVLELNLMPGGSKLTASDVLDFFLHQAGHALAGPETASEGRYHGYKYKAAAEELGLDPGKYTTLGWKNTSLTEDTVALYEPQIRALDDALKAWEPTTQIKATRSSRNAVSAQCSCSPPRKIRLGEKTLRGASITCGACGQRFLPSG